MLQLSPSILVKTPNGEGRAILVINHGSALPLEWVVINQKTEEFESWRTQDIKPNIATGRGLESYSPAQPSGVAQSLSTTVQSQTLVI